MNPQETQVLESFLNQLVQARAGAKDPQAETLIAEALARQPDAAYLLVQRSLLLDQALASAKAQIAQLQNQVQAAQGSSSSFLDSANTWGNSANAAPPARPSAPVSAPVAASPYAPQPQVTAAAPSRPGFFSGGFGGALGNIATTAAGVAGGAFLFQGIENLFHHNNGNGFLAQPLGGMPRDETIINNYYGSDDTQARDDSFNNVLDDNYSDDSLPDDDSSII